jgi:hypothetical protein
MAVMDHPADLGQTAYAAYGQAVGGVTHEGRPLPTWADLSSTTQTA